MSTERLTDGGTKIRAGSWDGTGGIDSLYSVMHPSFPTHAQLHGSPCTFLSPQRTVLTPKRLCFMHKVKKISLIIQSMLWAARSPGMSSVEQNPLITKGKMKPDDSSDCHILLETFTAKQCPFLPANEPVKTRHLTLRRAGEITSDEEYTLFFQRT